MNKTELLEQCKRLGIKGVSCKNKSELIAILQQYTTINDKSTIGFVDVLRELKIKTPLDKVRKPCKNCGEFGHDSKNLSCPFRCELKRKIINNLGEMTVEENCVELSKILNISPHLCRTLYNEIPMDDLLLKRSINVDAYLKNVIFIKCKDCNKPLIETQTNSIRNWKGDKLCDLCWAQYASCRESLWREVSAYKRIKCVLCCSEQCHPTERYHYDHINMFDKDSSICAMVNDGMDIMDICREVDKCQILCLSCHHIITDIEHKLGFTRIKQSLTRKLNNGEYTESEYNEKKLYYQNIYNEKMNGIYQELHTHLFIKHK
jgi:hypothetical protein